MVSRFAVMSLRHHACSHLRCSPPPSCHSRRAQSAGSAGRACSAGRGTIRYAISQVVLPAMVRVMRTGLLGARGTQPVRGGDGDGFDGAGLVGGRGCARGGGRRPAPAPRADLHSNSSANTSGGRLCRNANNTITSAVNSGNARGRLVGASRSIIATSCPYRQFHLHLPHPLRNPSTKRAFPAHSGALGRRGRRRLMLKSVDTPLTCRPAVDRISAKVDR